MKKLLFGAVMLMGTLTFASTGEGNENDLQKNDLNTERYGCFPFTLSCGIGGTACGDNTADLIDLILVADDLIC